MKSRPIIMVDHSVRAILEGRKTQTRRVIKIHPSSELLRTVTLENGSIESVTLGGNIGVTYKEYQEYFKFHYGQVGDQLWVRESIRAEPEDVFYKADGISINLALLTKEQDEWIQDYGRVDDNYSVTIPSIHMKRFLSRITLEITKIRVERVQEISEEDAIREGIVCSFQNTPHDKCDVIDQYRDLWNILNKKRGYGWDKNCWIWVLEFKRIK